MQDGIIPVGLIGGSASGKTTMLLALETYASQLDDPHGIWTYQGMDPRSIAWLKENRGKMQKGIFHEPSSGVTELSFLLFRGSRRVCIQTQERPGGDYDSVMLDDAMLEYLANCAGLIFLLSPRQSESQTPTSDLIRDLLTSIDVKLGGGTATGSPLKHRVAVCISQYDDAEFFQWLKKKNVLAPNVFNGVKNTPLVPSKRIPKLLEDADRFPDGAQILHQFAARFHPDNVNFYAISSIGFYKRPGANSIDWNDCDNVAVTPSGERIRSAPDIHPVMLLAPLGWIISQERSGWQPHIR